MQATVILLTDRASFPQLWRPLLEGHELEVRVRTPDTLASIERGSAVVLDAATSGYDEDELLTTVGFVRARGALPIVHLADDGDLSSVEDVIEEMCCGLVIREHGDIARVASGLASRLDSARPERFEFVTISPREGEILAILGDGGSTLLKRPVSANDDGSDVVSISLADDARTVTLGLSSSATVELAADSTAPSSASPGAGDPTLVPPARLGSRLRFLRLEAGLTQAELARRTGIHRPNIARVEAGRHIPSVDTLYRLAEAIGVSPVRVLTED